MRDLEAYSMNSLRVDEVLAVGWIENCIWFPRGRVPDDFRVRLRELVVRYPVLKLHGRRGCPVCFRREIVIDSDGDDYALGSYQLWIPEGAGYYAAPDRIVHYVERHWYRPPSVFIDRVLAFQPRPDWDADAEVEGFLERVAAARYR